MPEPDNETVASAGVSRAAAREFASQGSGIGLIVRGEDGLEGTKKENEGEKEIQRGETGPHVYPNCIFRIITFCGRSRRMVLLQARKREVFMRMFHRPVGEETKEAREVILHLLDGRGTGQPHPSAALSLADDYLLIHPEDSAVRSARERWSGPEAKSA